MISVSTSAAMAVAGVVSACAVGWGVALAVGMQTRGSGWALSRLRRLPWFGVAALLVSAAMMAFVTPLWLGVVTAYVALVVVLLGRRVRQVIEHAEAMTGGGFMAQGRVTASARPLAAAGLVLVGLGVVDLVTGRLLVAFLIPAGFALFVGGRMLAGRA